MICPHCGQEIQGQALFCPNCGQKLHGAAQTSMRPAPVDASAPQAEGRGCTQSLIVLTVALIVVLAIIGVGVLAVYYGLADRAKVEQQVAEDHYGKGLAHLDRGELELAVAEFELVLQLAPKHQAAQDRLREARQALEAQPTATPMLLEETKAARFEELRQAHAAGDWDAVLEAADRLLALDSAYRRDDVNRMLFDAFYQSGQELLAQDRIKEAVGRFDYALALQPDNVQLAHARKLASLYMAGMGYWGADWARAIEQLSALYTLAPDYRDVRQRVYDAHLIYGDMLAQNQDWCRAAEQYAAALGVSMDAAAVTKRQEASTRCASDGQPTPEPGTTVSPETPWPAAPSGTFVGDLVERTGIDPSKMFIRGKVLDRDGKGIQDTRVKIQAWDWSALAITDGNGQYAFDGLANPVTYTLTLLDLPSTPFDVAGVWGRISWVDFREAR